MNPSLQSMTRREFLVVAGCGCAGLMIAGAGCARVSQATAAAAEACPYGYRYDAYPGQCYRFIDSNGSGYCDFSEPVVTVVTAPTTTATTGAATTTTAQTAAAATTVEETRVVLCDRGCSAPGRCGRFVDSDGTGVCDLTEGIVISVSSAATATATTAPAATATTGLTTSAATATPAATATAATAAATTAATSVALVILCDRGCRYPGSCGRYTDANGTGKCDLSEGIPADQAAAYGGAGGSSRGRGGRGG